jgi:hypothetical protein
MLLTSAANSIDGGTRNISFSEERNWHSAMKAIHRSFYSSVVSFAEKGCADLCATKDIKVVARRQSNVDKILQLIEQNSSMPTDIKKKVEAKVRNLVGLTPAFSDYIEATIKASKLQSRRAAMWRKYFKALSIVRNKASHSNHVLSQDEAGALRNNGFAALVSSTNELQLNTTNYKQICDHVLLFFKEAMS